MEKTTKDQHDMEILPNLWDAAFAKSGKGQSHEKPRIAGGPPPLSLPAPVGLMACFSQCEIIDLQLRFVDSCSGLSPMGNQMRDSVHMRTGHSSRRRSAPCQMTVPGGTSRTGRHSPERITSR